MIWYPTVAFMNKSISAGKTHLGMFVPELLQAVVAAEEMGFGPRLEVCTVL